ncbi:MAG TPA: DUF2993 domain-containing protein [Actinomycetota bacterium]|nr:DUF2993 domain-containing protein [Actinomycetota bacterium]
MRKLLALVVVAGLLVAGDAWLRSAAEARVVAELERSLDASGETDVSLGGFPFVFRLVAGTIPSARITSETVVRDRVRLRALRMTLQDLTFSVGEIAAGRAASIAVRDGRGSALVASASVRAAFARVRAPIDIQIGAQGVRASLGPRSSRGRLYIEGSDLVLALDVTDRTFRVPLPRFLDGLTYDSVTVADSQVLVEFSVTDASLRGR